MTKTYHMAELEVLVKELAESNAVLTAGFPGTQAVFKMCRYCFAEDYGDDVEHRDTCLWVRAKALVQ